MKNLTLPIALFLFMSFMVTPLMANEDDKIPENDLSWKKEYKSIKLYPSEEVSSIVYVDLDEIDAEEYTVELESANGVNMLKATYNDKSFNLMVHELRPGKYLIKIVTDKYVYTKSFVKV